MANVHVTPMRSPRKGPLIAVVLLAAVSAALRFWATRGLDVPWIAPDESIYALLGRSLWEDGSPSLLGAAGRSYSLVYSALVGLPLTLDDLGAGVTIAQAVGALLMSATALVVYLWGRGPLGAWWAVVAAGLTVAVPGLAYSGFLMSEVAIYPLATRRALGDRVDARAPLIRPAGARRRRDPGRTGDARPAGCAHSHAVCSSCRAMRLRAVTRAGTASDRPARGNRVRSRRDAGGVRARRPLE